MKNQATIPAVIVIAPSTIYIHLHPASVGVFICISPYPRMPYNKSLQPIAVYRECGCEIAGHGEERQSSLHFISLVPATDEIHTARKKATLKSE